MFCRARTRLFAAQTAVLATALMVSPAGASMSDVAVPATPAAAPSAAQIAGLVGALSTASCRGSLSRPGSRSTAKLRAALLCLVNRERAGAGLGPLRASRRLALAARRHAADMARRGYFDHISPSGRGPAARARAVGWHGSIGEVLAWGCGSLSTPAATLAAWLNSPPHRAIILGSGRDAGIGIGSGGHASCARQSYWVMETGW